MQINENCRENMLIHFSSAIEKRILQVKNKNDCYVIG